MTFAAFLFLVFSGAPFLSGHFVTGIHVVYTTQAFYLPISRSFFDNFGEDDLVEYRASLLNMPDLPRWMYYRHPNGSDLAFLYGAPEEAGDVNVEIIALNKKNYETSRRIINFQVQHRGKEAKFEAEMKLLNLNIEDLFEGSRLKQIEDIFKDHLWKSSESVYVTMLASSVDVGGRRPLNPKDKEGVVVRVGGTHNFSQDLLDLEREVFPLRKRYPCPKDYIRTAAEYLFRKGDFLSDWCSFRLVYHKYGKINDGRKSDSSSADILPKDEKFEFHLPTSRVPRRDFLFDFVLSLIVPLVLVFVLLLSLACAFCCHRGQADTLNKETTCVQLSTFNSMQRGRGGTVAHLRTNVAARSEHPADISLPQTTPSPLGGSSNSLTRSRTGSPSSTLPKPTSTGYESRSNTLRPGGLLPPPPYAPSRANSGGDHPIYTQ